MKKIIDECLTIFSVAYIYSTILVKHTDLKDLYVYFIALILTAATVIFLKK